MWWVVWALTASPLVRLGMGEFSRVGRWVRFKLGVGRVRVCLPVCACA